MIPIVGTFSTLSGDLNQGVGLAYLNFGVMWDCGLSIDSRKGEFPDTEVVLSHMVRISVPVV